MNQFVKTNIPGFVKNSQSPMILNTDETKLLSIISNRQKKKEDERFKQEMMVLKDTVNDMQTTLKEILKWLKH